MIFLLDTNTCIAIIRGTDLTLLGQVRELSIEVTVFLLSIVEFEVLFGVANSHPERRTLNSRKLGIFFSHPFLRYAFTTEDAYASAAIRADLKAAGTPIGAYDLLIAGQCIQNQCTVVTANVKEFSRVSGLKWVNWASLRLPQE